MTSDRWTLPSVTESFLAMEDELDLLRGSLGRIWEGARFSIHQRLLDALGAVREGQVQYPTLQPSRIRRAWAHARSALSRPSLASGRADFLIVGHPRRRRTPDGTWTDPYVDPLLASLDAPVRVVEPPHLGQHRSPAHVPGVRYLDDVILLGAAAGMLGARRPTPPERRAMEAVTEAVRGRFGVDVAVGDRMDEFRLHRAGSLRFYDRLLAGVQPKVLVLVVAYGQEPLVEVARARGITVVELQHGVIHPYHLGYTFPSAPKSTFPDHLLTFGRFWAEATRYPIPRDRVRAVGYPAFDLARSTFDRRPNATVLFVSQLAVGEHLSRMAVEFARRAGEPVVYKLHPGEVHGWADRYPWLRGSAVQVADDPGLSVYDLFRTARAQVGVFSTALYEGLGLGVPTVVAQLPGWEACEPLLSLGYARAAADASELEAAMCSLSGSKDADVFFEPGGLTRMTAALQEIVGR
ncbi:MAG TPA: hypothetical protein VM198_05700 [Longimicrobiales bacterium]|nr:hypothetical protein [Longimicrobiales bacterium]